MNRYERLLLSVASSRCLSRARCPRRCFACLRRARRSTAAQRLCSNVSRSSQTTCVPALTASAGKTLTGSPPKRAAAAQALVRTSTSESSSEAYRHSRASSSLGTHTCPWHRTREVVRFKSVRTNIYNIHPQTLCDLKHQGLHCMAMALKLTTQCSE